MRRGELKLRRIRRLCVLGLVTGLAVLACAGSAGAAQTERITDGGFESTACFGSSRGSCTSDIWLNEGPQAFNCRSPQCVGGPASGTGFFSFGGADAGQAAAGTSGETVQQILIPEAPAILSFKAAIYPGTGAKANFFEITIGNERAIGFDPNTLTTTYKQFSVDVSSFAASGTQQLALEMNCFGVGAGGKTCPSMNVDDLSLLTGTPPPPTPGGGGGEQPPGAGGGGGAPSDPVALAKPTFKSHPPKRTTNHQAKFKFSGSASDFQCSLDGGAFKACVSPRIFRVGLGEHVFKVRGVAIGKSGPAASFEWKVVKKHRRHHR